MSRERKNIKSNCTAGIENAGSVAVVPCWQRRLEGERPAAGQKEFT